MEHTARGSAHGVIPTKRDFASQLHQQLEQKRAVSSEAQLRDKAAERAREESRQAEAARMQAIQFTQRQRAIQIREENARMAEERRRNQAAERPSTAPAQPVYNYRELLQTTYDRHASPKATMKIAKTDVKRATFQADGTYIDYTAKGGNNVAKVNAALQDQSVTPWRVACEAEKDRQRLAERHTPRYSWMVQRNPITHEGC